MKDDTDYDEVFNGLINQLGLRRYLGKNPKYKRFLNDYFEEDEGSADCEECLAIHSGSSKKDEDEK